MRILPLCLPLILLGVLAPPTRLAAQTTPTDEQSRAAQQAWGREVAGLLALDARESHPDDALLFLGSSSVRLWAGIARDLAPFHPIRRAYGGARFADLVVFADRLARPHRFRAVVIFAANDVTGAANDPDPGAVAAWFAGVGEAARRHQPGAAVFCIEITPTPARWAAWPQIQAVNAALRETCEAREGWHFIPTATAFLNGAGEPRNELFREDKLHLNESGYALWARLIKKRLSKILAPAG
jgi:hypothetical protein